MRVLVMFFGLALGLGSASTALAQREHRVRQGQSLARIAGRYHVPVAALAGANRLAIDAPLRPGTVLMIPGEGEIYVVEGQTLGAIARAHDVSVEELARANRIRVTSTLRPGQRLVLPGHGPSESADPRAARGWGRPRTSGVGVFLRDGDARNRKTKVRLVDAAGRVRRTAIAQMSSLLQPPRQGRVDVEVHARLVKLLAKVSDHFGGRSIHIVSGFRSAGGYTSERSRHTRGHAIDFRISGVPNAAIRDFCRTFDNVGVGYYPNSSFIHLDVRSENASWVDYAGPGEAPRYRGTRPPRGRAEIASAAANPAPVPEQDEDDGSAPTEDADATLSDE